MAEPLGRKPISTPLILSAGADFELVLTPATGYPSGIDARIALYATDATDAVELDSWSATVATTSEISWRIESEVADTIPAQSVYRLFAIFPETPTLERCWYRGRVQRQQ